ncbi:MAG TPA: hypothetical protein VH092_33215 [Urbifossiella sp.]|jgi:hypothetical protein|nr:hypothetical protein [Urbifossiella sp.]
MPPLHLATFRCDVTPPLGHPLCGGWIEPVRGVDDPLQALGVVLLGGAKPVVFCVLDWVAVRNEAFRSWRRALAEAAHTTPEHVHIHAVHPHNAPFADNEAQRLIAVAKAPPSLDLDFFNDCVKRSADALRTALPRARRFTHVGTGSTRVNEVASSRRIVIDGVARFSRTSATKSREVRDHPEGLIDPVLRTLSFWDGDRPLAALHYYACHPMSYYGDGRVSADFCGLARQKRQDEDEAVFQVYFNGCAGNVTAGKYNDGARENRAVLRDRMHAAMTAAWRGTTRTAVDGFEWRFEPVRLPPRREAAFGEEASRAALNDEKATAARRNNAAFQLAWLKRTETPIEVGCLDFGGRVLSLHLPGEAFVEYQLAAQRMRPDASVFVAAYGDDGPGYIPTARAYIEGGYEPTVALSGPDSEEILLRAARKLFRAEGKVGGDR